MAGRQLLQANLIPRAPLVVPRVAFSHARAISTTAPRPAPRELKPKATLAPRTSAPTEGSTPDSQTPSGSRFAPSSLAATRSAANDHVYDATSHGTFDLSKIIAQESDDFMRKHYKQSNIELRMKPVLGRTVQISSRYDLADALRTLDVFTNKNKIKWQYRHQKVYERPGLRRKRLKMERWRKKFKIGFRATVKRVQELANQGW